MEVLISLQDTSLLSDFPACFYIIPSTMQISPPSPDNLLVFSAVPGSGKPSTIPLEIKSHTRFYCILHPKHQVNIFPLYLRFCAIAFLHLSTFISIPYKKL